MVRNFLLYVFLMLFMAFSSAHAQGLKGFVYQYEAPSNSHDSDPDPRVELIKNFLDKNWDVSALSETRKSAAALYASLFFVPRCYASLVPSAFMVPRCQSRKYANIVLYNGSVEAPESGWFRFVGTGDDMLLVSIGGQTVLEAGYCLPSGKKPASGTDENYQKRIGKSKYATALMPYPGFLTWNAELGGLTAGLPFYVEKGRIYNVKILYVDMAGCAGFCLLMEHLKSRNAAGKGKVKPSKDKPLDIFRVADHMPNQRDMELLIGRHKVTGGPMEWADFNQDSLVWTISPMQPTACIGKDGKSRNIGGDDSDDADEPRKKKSGKKEKQKRKKKSFRAV